MPNSEAAAVDVGAHSSNGRKVLVAEDSPITHDLLKLLLNQRGHQVDIATDGPQALEALRKRHYDVALLDFHLPSLDGAEVAAILKTEAKGRRLPRLVAITADVEGLLSHPGACENFDYVIPKPLDIYEVSKIVEDQAEFGDRQTVPEAPPVATKTAMRRTPFFESLGYQFLTWPDDLQATRQSARAMQASLGDPRFDAILIKEPASTDDLASIWRRKALHVLPVIDLTGTLGPAADLDASKLGTRDSDQLGRLVRRFQDQRVRLHRDLLFSDDQGEELLGRIFVAGRSLEPALDPRARNLISYNTILYGSSVARAAEALCAEELLERTFFDRFHVCSRCDSRRLYVREECTQCRSSNLVEKQYIHHFRCAYQGPETDFQRGDDLICPKCRRELAHFGFDYDRPGTMVVCRSCGHAASDPAIGFVCLDCGTRTDGESCRTLDAFSYQLTERGRGFAEHGRCFLGGVQRALRFAELPLDLVVALNAAAKGFNEERTPFTLVNIFYQNERDITAEHGARQFAQVRDLFIENLRAALGKSGSVFKGQSYDFALLRNLGQQQAQADFGGLQEHAQRTLRFDLGVGFQTFGPEDLA